jgi:hypothetical protein
VKIIIRDSFGGRKYKSFLLEGSDLFLWSQKPDFRCSIPVWAEKSKEEAGGSEPGPKKAASLTEVKTFRIDIDIKINQLQAIVEKLQVDMHRLHLTIKPLNSSEVDTTQDAIAFIRKSTTTQEKKIVMIETLGVSGSTVRSHRRNGRFLAPDFRAPSRS